ncbi:hypothetical protein HanRHA438_Chr11g0494401 [Helianthus annuus]|nr:hypothetical protein HanRHA438_Chr11g0494401 [Helianthus annuus]
MNNSRTASLYDVLEYEKRNISIPAKSDVSELLTPVKESLVGKNEFEIWMLRRDASVAAAKNEDGLDNKSEKLKDLSPVNMSAPENMKNDGFRDDDVSGEHSLAAAEDVTSINPSKIQPSDEGFDLRSKMDANGVGPAGEPDLSSSRQKFSSPIPKSPGISTSAYASNDSPSLNAVLPSATADVHETNIGPAVQARAQSKMSSMGPEFNSGNEGAGLDSMRFGSIDPSKLKRPTFQFVCDPNLKFGPNGVDVDPIFGTKFWNKELFSQLTKGLDIEGSETRLFYEPPNIEEGETIVDLIGHFMTKSIKAHRLQLYGYFMGDNLSFQTVKENLIKMWHKFGLKSINKKNGGFYFFTFENDEGMIQVLERNPWLVKNVPLALQLWQPDTILSKPDLDKVPIWVTIKDLPLCLWNGGNIGQIVSCVGKPLMMDKATCLRCETKKGPLNFARVLVEAKASCGLPTCVKVRFPSLNGLPNKIGTLDFSYKWKPPICGKCQVFGHLDSSHEEVQKPVEKTISKGKNIMEQPALKSVLKKPMVHNDGFTVVNRKKPNVKWAPLAKKDVDRLVHGSKVNDAGPSVARNYVAGSSGGSVVDRAAGPNLVTDLGGANTRPGPVLLDSVEQFPPLAAGPIDAAVGTGPAALRSLLSKAGPACSQDNKVGPTGPDLVDLGAVVKPGPNLVSPNIYGVNSDPVLMEVKGPKNGSGFYDISRNNFGSRQSPTLETKNSFDTLQNEEDCFDTEHGLWEKDMLKVRKFYETNTQPSDDVFKSWSEKLRAYYVMLTKFDLVNEAMVETKNEDEIEVKSETDESARDIARGV